jgi:hypothetical protein
MMPAVKMKITNPRVVGGFLGLAILLGGSGTLMAGPQTLAYEGFDYLEGGVAAGAATGIGWANAWGESGDSGDDQSELIIGPGSFPVPPGSPSTTGNHVDLNHQTGHRRITRKMAQSLGGGSGLIEHVFRIVLDFGPGGGVDYAGVELSHSAGGPVVFIGKPPGAGPGNPGQIGMDVYGQGFTGTGVGATGQKLLHLRWSPNDSGPDEVTLLVFNASNGDVLGSTSQSLEASFDQVTLVARRDLAFGGAIPAFDEIRATTGEIQTNLLTVASLSPAEGVQIGVSPADLNGAGSGSTLFERSYAYGESVVLTAPASASGNGFLKWTRDGADFSTRRTITIGMTEGHALTAVFQSSAKSLSVSASGVGAPVGVTVSPADLGGSTGGNTTLNLSYASGSTVSLTAPATASGAHFERWESNGVLLSENPTAQVTLTADTQVTAVYDFPLDESIGAISVEPDGIHLLWNAVGGRSYVIEASDNLKTFTAISDPIPVTGEGRIPTEWIEPLDSSPPKRFYRIKIIDP